MLDLKWIRENIEAARTGVAKKGAKPDWDRLLKLDQDRREAQTQADQLKAKRNGLSAEVGKVIKSGGDAEPIKAEVRTIGDEITALDHKMAQLDADLQGLLLEIPNIPHDSVPVGASEEENRVVRYWGEKPDFSFAPKPHWDLAEQHSLIDFARGAKISGSGFIAYTGAGARLQRVLINHMLDLHTRAHGYNEVNVPHLVHRSTMTGTGQLPKFEDQLYRIDPDDLFLIPTAEVPVTNLHREEILSADQLPVKLVGHTPCFRREAGASGSDTRGIIRVHQFDKIELVWLTRPEASMSALDDLMAHAEAVLQGLGLHYRVLEICTGDLGFSNCKQYDLEVWAPGVGRYLEVSSCSNFWDYQARRAGIRFRPDAKAKPEFVHTLNGSGVALPRLMIALLENYQQADGSIAIPQALQHAFGAASIG